MWVWVCVKSSANVNPDEACFQRNRTKTTLSASQCSLILNVSGLFGARRGWFRLWRTVLTGWTDWVHNWTDEFVLLWWVVSAPELFFSAKITERCLDEMYRSSASSYWRNWLSIHVNQMHVEAVCSKHWETVTHRNQLTQPHAPQPLHIGFVEYWQTPYGWNFPPIS